MSLNISFSDEKGSYRYFRKGIGIFNKFPIKNPSLSFLYGLSLEMAVCAKLGKVHKGVSENSGILRNFPTRELHLTSVTCRN